VAEPEPLTWLRGTGRRFAWKVIARAVCAVAALADGARMLIVTTATTGINGFIASIPPAGTGFRHDVRRIQI
jgi:hypothetical protein